MVAGQRFTTLASGAALPSGSQCAALVRPVAESRPENYVQNHHVGTPSPSPAGVTGAFTGTTDEILQWGACKWGIDEDMVRAMAWQESRWNQDAAGDVTPNTDPMNCGAGQVIENGSCPESIGITQVRTLHYEEYDRMLPWTSTAYNVDVWGHEMRTCFDGGLSHIPYIANQGYHGNDLWGCLGWWFSGNWHDQAADGYIADVHGHLDARSWPVG